MPFVWGIRSSSIQTLDLFLILLYLASRVVLYYIYANVYRLPRVVCSLYKRILPTPG